MINVLYINHSSRVSGSEISLMNILKTLDGDSYFPVLVCPGGGTMSKELIRMGIQTELLDIVRFKKSRNAFVLLSYFFRYLGALCKLLRICSRHSIDLIHSNSSNSQIYGSVAAKLLGIPSIWHVRDMVPLGVLGRILYRLSAKIIVPSEAVRSNVLMYRSGKRPDGGAEVPGSNRSDKVEVIHNGLILEEWNMATAKSGVREDGVEGICIREEFGIDPREHLIGMVGQLVPWKKHSDFLEAGKIILDEIPNTKFLVVGEDLFGEHKEYKNEIKALCTELSIEDRVIFTGYRDDIMEIMAAIDVLAVPSRDEPFGRVILEAMAMGKPVVSTDTGGAPEIIEDGSTGTLIRQGDPGELSRAVIQLLGDSGMRMKMGEEGRRRVEEHFDMKKLIKKVETVYQELVKE